MSTRHVHQYRRLSDTAVFCQGCGDIKGAEPCTLQHFYPVAPYIVQPCTRPHYPTWPQPYVYPTIWYGTTTGTTSIGTTVTADQGMDNVTYTLAAAGTSS